MVHLAETVRKNSQIIHPRNFSYVVHEKIWQAKQKESHFWIAIEVNNIYHKYLHFETKLHIY